eukprot:1145203-Pelagomonas_calceolata.AAC.6
MVLSSLKIDGGPALQRMQTVQLLRLSDLSDLKNGIHAPGCKLPAQLSATLQACKTCSAWTQGKNGALAPDWLSAMLAYLQTMDLRYKYMICWLLQYLSSLYEM